MEMCACDVTRNAKCTTVTRMTEGYEHLLLAELIARIFVWWGGGHLAGAAQPCISCAHV